MTLWSWPSGVELIVLCGCLECRDELLRRPICGLPFKVEVQHDCVVDGRHEVIGNVQDHGACASVASFGFHARAEERVHVQFGSEVAEGPASEWSD